MLNSQTALAYDWNYTFDAVQPMVGASCRNKDANGNAGKLLSDCPDLAYLKTIDGRPVTVNQNWGKPIPPPLLISAFQAPLSMRLALFLAF